MRNKREHTRHAVVLLLAVAGLITCAAPFSASSGPASAQASAPTWSYTGSLNTARAGYTPTLRANGKISFTSDRDGNREIYVMDAGGTNQVRLTNNSVVDDHATWSPDGTKIAFVSERPTGGFALSLMNADGTNKTEITPINFDTRYPIWDAWAMSWSPDGNRIVFQEKPDPSAFPNDIFIVNIDGSDRRALVNGPEDERQPAWSPDGSRILFSKQVSTFFHNLYTVKPDGTDLRALAHVDGETDLAPSWSPAGDIIAFQIFDYANFENVGIANADGSDRQWFDSGSLNPDYGGRDKPQWSPDGSKIIFQVSRDDIGTEIYVKEINGTGLTQVTNTPGNNFKPSWQPRVSAACPNPIDCADFFVRQHYRDFLAREPEQSGLDAWLNVLNNCPAGDAVCLHEARLTTSAAFFGSPEFQLKGYFVFRFYKASFNRLPEYGEIAVDMQSITGQTPAEVYAHKAAFTDSFGQRPEFFNSFGALSNAHYVSLLLGRYGLTSVTTPDPAQPDGTAKVTLTDAELVSRLDAGMLTRAQVLRAVADSDEVFAAEFNQAFVAMQYYGYLRRTPEAGGYNAWLAYLTAHPNDFRTMVRGFVDSIEYRIRFGQP